MTRRSLIGLLLLSSGAPSSMAEDGHALATEVQLDRVRVPETRLIVGSTLDQIVSATERCTIEADSTCDLQEYSPELSSGQSVLVSSFWIDRHEVSVDKFRRCVHLGHCRAPRYDTTIQTFRRPDLPVVLVSFDDAKQYCAFVGGAVPTEEQFEAAGARGRDRTYPWGSRFHTRLSNFGARQPPYTNSRDGFELLAPVGAFAAGRSENGIFQLAGNAAEWTSSPFIAHDGKAIRPMPAQQLVVKGGSFQTLPVDQRIQARRAMSSSEVAVDVGFRCVYPTARAR